MNERITKQIEEMKKQTIGVEVEMNNIRRDKAAELAAAFFGTGRFENTASRNGYYTWSAWDASGREWKFQKDVSIAGPDDKKCELVTPILHYEDIELLQELIRKLRHAGAKSDATRGCGVHIHIGAKGHTPQTLRNLANIMAGHENLLADALNLDSWRMNRYCKTVDPRCLRAIRAREALIRANQSLRKRPRAVRHGLRMRQRRNGSGWQNSWNIWESLRKSIWQHSQDTVRHMRDGKRQRSSLHSTGPL